MATRPAYSTILDRINADIRSLLGLPADPPARSVLGVFARVIAGASHLMHGRIDYGQKQLFPDSQDATSLARDADLRGIAPRTAATFANVLVSGTGTNGSLLPETSLFFAETGQGFRIDADTTVAGGVWSAQATALTAGSGSNITGEVSSAEPIAGINSLANIDSVTVDGAEAEELEDFRARVIARRQSVERGGTLEDYRIWLLEQPGVTRAWTYRHRRGLGTVDGLFVRDGDGVGSAIIPSVGEVTAVQDAIDADHLPATDDFLAIAPTALEVDFTIALTPDTTAARDAVNLQLDDLFLRLGEPSVTIPLLELQFAISLGATSAGSTFVLTAPAADVTPATDELPIRGAMTWP